jgi:exosortase H (IPTLxxWG-CTERM-specific)
MRGSKKKYTAPWSPHRLPTGPELAGGKVSLAKRLIQGSVAWFRAKNPVLQFVVLFGLLIGLFYALTVSAFFQHTVSPPYLRCSARMASVVCNCFGQHTTAINATISSIRFSLQIIRGCDAVEPLALFLAAVLAFPAPFRQKIPGLLLGALILALANLVRIASLFLTGVYFPRAFQQVHQEVWPVAFVLLAIVLWALWIQWAMKPRPAVTHAPS